MLCPLSHEPRKHDVWFRQSRSPAVLPKAESPLSEEAALSDAELKNPDTKPGPPPAVTMSTHPSARAALGTCSAERPPPCVWNSHPDAQPALEPPPPVTSDGEPEAIPTITRSAGPRPASGSTPDTKAPVPPAPLSPPPWPPHRNTCRCVDVLNGAAVKLTN